MNRPNRAVRPTGLTALSLPHTAPAKALRPLLSRKVWILGRWTLFTWLPIEEPDLTVGPVMFTERRVLAVAAEHELTRHASVSLEIAGDFQFPDTESTPDYWVDSYLPPQTRKGRAIERGPLVRSAEDLLTLTSLGETVTFFPDHITRYWARPDVAYLPVRDMDALLYASVWHTESENDLIRAFAQVVRDLGPRST